MNFDQRNIFGFPVVLKREIAKEYAAESIARNKQSHQCETCKRKEQEEVVIKMINGWK